MMSIDKIRCIVFLLFYILFFIEDIRNKSVHNIIFILYFIVGFIIFLGEIFNESLNNDMDLFIIIFNLICSSFLGFLLYLISISTKEAIGRGDAIYFIINGLYLNVKDNLLLLLTGIFVSFIISIIIFIKYQFNIKNKDISFLPCLFPVIIWRVVCIL